MAYRPVNAFSHSPSLLSIITALLYILLITLHSVYVVPGVVRINNPILWVLLGITYAALLFMIHDYFWIMLHDPVDRLVLDQNKDFDLQDTEDCAVCGKRWKGSHHCSICNRCSQGFDHHCKFLNNCIGSRNYEKFIRLLSLNILFLTLQIGQSIWVFIRALRDPTVRSAIPASFWVIIGLITISAILLIAILILQVFHCYISMTNVTTLGFITRNDNPDPDPPLSNRHFQV